MLKNYFKVAIRNLFKNKAFSVINIAGLAIGLTGFTLIYMYVTFELSYDKFHDDSDRIYRVVTDQVVEADVLTRDAMSFAPEGRALMDELPEIEAFTTTQKMWGNFNLRVGDQLFTEKAVVAADTNFLKLFNYPVIKGDASDPLREPDKMILTESTARKYFGNENPLGKLVHVYSGLDKSFQVVGIIEDVPQNTHYKFDMLISFESIRERWENDAWGGYNYYTFIKVAEGINIDALRAKMWALAPKYLNEETTLVFTPQKMEDIHLYSNLTFEPEVHGNMRTVYFLSIISIFIIIIAWVNYINLSTAKAMDRAKEVGLRKVVGAQKFQLVKQFLIESLLLNFVSAVLALTAIQILAPFFNTLVERQIILNVWSDAALLITMSVLFLVGTILSGFYPAMVLSSFKPVAVLRGKLRTSFKGIMLRKGLVIFQFCTSLALIAGTMIVYLQLDYMRNRDIGINIDQVVAVTEPRIAPDDSLGLRKIETFQNQIRQLPPVASIGVTSSIPGGGSSDISSFSGGLRLDGEAESDRSTYYVIVTDEKFAEVVDLKLLAGRNFIKGMASDTSAVIINETVMKRLGFQNPEDAIDHYVQIGNNEDAERQPIIGVFSDFNRQTLRNATEPILFFRNTWGTAGYQTARITGNIRETMAEIENIWFDIFPNTPFEYIFLDDKFDIAYKSDRTFGQIFSIFAVLAIVIACLGLFGLSSFIAVQKTKEIGVRKVLGATVPSILFLLSSGFLQLIGYGLIIGIPLVYFGMNQWLDNYAFRINFPWWVFALAAITLVIITLITVSYQTLKAALANPSKALRYE
ncbi:MAG: ABC transporter permease [Cyclobacteriaceae bacterium]